MSCSYAIGIDVGGTNIKTVAVTPTGERLFQSRQPTLETETAWAERIREQIAQIETEQGQAAWVGLAAPGLAAPDGRSIAWMQGRMESVQGLDWTTYLGSPYTISILNDAHAALLGEAWQGAAAGCQNVVMLTLGTGVGGGAIVNGHLLRGYIGRAGHLGHISLDPNGRPDIVGTPGSLEDAIGECTLLKRSGGRFATTEQLVQAHHAGDREAAALWQQTVQTLSAGLVSFINVLDPEVIILGGGMAKAGDTLLGPLQTYLDRWEWRPTGSKVRLVAAALGEFAGAFGAAYNALQVNQPLRTEDASR